MLNAEPVSIDFLNVYSWPARYVLQNIYHLHLHCLVFTVDHNLVLVFIFKLLFHPSVNVIFIVDLCESFIKFVWTMNQASVVRMFECYRENEIENIIWFDYRNKKTDKIAVDECSSNCNQCSYCSIKKEKIFLPHLLSFLKLIFFSKYIQWLINFKMSFRMWGMNIVSRLVD